MKAFPIIGNTVSVCILRSSATLELVTCGITANIILTVNDTGYSLSAALYISLAAFHFVSITAVNIIGRRSICTCLDDNITVSLLCCLSIYITLIKCCTAFYIIISTVLTSRYGFSFCPCIIRSPEQLIAVCICHNISGYIHFLHIRSFKLIPVD